MDENELLQTLGINENEVEHESLYLVNVEIFRAADEDKDLQLSGTRERHLLLAKILILRREWPPICSQRYYIASKSKAPKSRNRGDSSNSI